MFYINLFSTEKIYFLYYLNIKRQIGIWNKINRRKCDFSALERENTSSESF